ncbi:MAG: lysophospholipid acyltransferase family protein [Bacteroidaceae bacterium]|nr:lysophospholipid acyltransferase family protein [Bacteroidaceae bacterium]
MHKWLIRGLRYLDVRILYVFVAVFIIPVCLVLNPSCGIAYRYFRQRHGYGRLKAAWSTYKNHCLFGQVVVDRFAMYAGKTFDIEVEGEPVYQQLAAEEKGFVQLSAHVGNYEIAGYTMDAKQKRINALVFFGEKESVMRSRMKMFSTTNTSMIAVRPDMGHVFEIVDALNRGEVVSMPADRIFGSDQKLTLDFLGGKADFPLGPFKLATAVGLDVITMHVMKTASCRYKIVVRRLDYDKDASSRDKVSQLSQAYVNQLQEVVRDYPTQWYNYFEFWNA